MWHFIAGFVMALALLYAVGAVGAYLEYRRRPKQRLTITGIQH